MTTETFIVHMSVQLIPKMHGIRFAENFEIVHGHGKTGDVAGSMRILRVVELTVVGNTGTFAVRQPKGGCWGDWRWVYGCWGGFRIGVLAGR